MMLSNKILEGFLSKINSIFCLEHHSPSTVTFITLMTPLMDFFGLVLAIFMVKKLGIKKLFCLSATLCILNTFLFSILGYYELYSIQKFTIWTIKFSYSLGIPAALFSYVSAILPFIGNTITISTFYLLGFIIM